MDTYGIYDERNRQIKPGTKVKMGDFHGVVTKITDIDGDADSEGCAYTIYPEVEVKFDDGIVDRYMTYAKSYTGPLVCDEVEVAA
jgi:hypothetical protein